MVTSFFHLSGEGLPADISVVGYQAREGVSVPFEIEVDFSTQDEAFVVDACLRKPLLLTVVDSAGSQRVFHGVVDEAAFVQALEPHLSFRLRLRPALAALSHREGSRIYQNKSVQEIARTVEGPERGRLHAERLPQLLREVLRHRHAHGRLEHEAAPGDRADEADGPPHPDPPVAAHVQAAAGRDAVREHGQVVVLGSESAIQAAAKERPDWLDVWSAGL